MIDGRLDVGIRFFFRDIYAYLSGEEIYASSCDSSRLYHHYVLH